MALINCAKNLSLVWPLAAILISVGSPSTSGRHERNKEMSRFEYTEYHMGVDVRMVVYAPEISVAQKACAAAFERFADMDTAMSDYRPASELMRLCAKAGGPPVHVSDDLFVALQRSQELAMRSGGAFDATCGPLVRLWRKARKTRRMPPAAEVRDARARMGWRNIVINARRHTVQLKKPGMLLDLGGIGKGYADDCAQRVLRQNGISSALVEAGGDIVVTGAPPGESGWRIEVPNAGTDVPILFSNSAISTSGDLEQSVVIDGRRYSHIVDPRSGRPLLDRIQVTIVARNGLTSDGLSTAVSVLGAENGRALAAMYPGAKAYIRYASADERDPAAPHRFERK